MLDPRQAKTSSKGLLAAKIAQGKWKTCIFIS